MDHCYHIENLFYIRQYLQMFGKPTVWAAWGTLIEKRFYLKNCLLEIAREIHRFEPRWITIGKVSKEGHPHHPLYLSHKSEIQEFDIKKYLEQIK